MVIGDGGIPADEIELVDAGFHVYAGASGFGEFPEKIESPERSAEGIADALFAAAAE